MLMRLALRSLRRHRRRTALTVAAIAAGAGMVIFAWGFGEGLAGWLTQTAVSGRVGALQVHARGYLDAIDANPITIDLAANDVLPVIRATPGVKAAAPRLKFAAIVSTGRSSSMVQVEAIDPVKDAEVCPSRYTGFDAGGPLSADAGRSVVIGHGLAESLGVKVGDPLTIMASTRAGAQNALDFTVAGITRGAAFMESRRMLTTRLIDAEELLSMTGRTHEVAIALHHPDDSEAVKQALATALQNASTAAANTSEVHTWQDVSPFLRDGVARIRIILRGVALVLFVVVVLGVANTVLMSVFERVREIGTFVALGMKRARVLQLFVLEAVVMGLVGGVSGGALGSAVVLFLGARGLDFTPPGSEAAAVLYPVLSPALVVGVAVATLVGAVLASFFPARRASRLDPVEALRST